MLTPEGGRAVPHQHVHLLERALVEEQLNSLPRGQLALLVLAFHGALAAGVLRFFA